MSKNKAQSKVLAPYAVEEACRRLGGQIAVARKRRRLTQVELAQKAGLSFLTVIRIEKGSPTTELGSYVRVLWAMGLEQAVSTIAAPQLDEVGQTLERARLPKRVRRKKEPLDDDF
jgi:transcriptional regulator with XRE-family HTH domain